MEFNLAAVHEAIEAAIPDQECIVWRDRRLSWREVGTRTRQLANHLLAQGLGCRREREGLSNHESGQDHLALYLYNGNEYLEAMLGGFKARVAPFNVNYRYVEEELLYLLRDARCRGVVYHASLASRLEAVLSRLPNIEVLIQVNDEPGVPLLEGAIDYEDALARASASRPDLVWSADDLYILYTGGTTGMPKGVLWRQGDVFVSALGGQSEARSASEFDCLDTIVERAVASKGRVRSLPAPPFMHGAALSAGLKRMLIDAIEGLVILDAVGSSESGGQGQHFSSGKAGASTGTFVPNPGNVVVSEDLSRFLDPGDPELGWFASKGRVPLGYLGDAAKTASTFPVIEDKRCAIPGDRARMRRDGVVELYGRDAATINSGGEKIFAEEVEQALKRHPAIYDAVVVGRPSNRWGSEVVAVVALDRGARVSESEILETCAKHLARYKLPKAFIFRSEIVRSPSGKADYRWAKEQLKEPDQAGR